MVLTLRLFKTMFDYVRTCTTATELVACFHPKHEALYEFLHLEPLAGMRPYAAVNGRPLQFSSFVRSLSILEGGMPAAMTVSSTSRRKICLGGDKALTTAWHARSRVETHRLRRQCHWQSRHHHCRLRPDDHEVVQRGGLGCHCSGGRY